VMAAVISAIKKTVGTLHTYQNNHHQVTVADK